MAQQAIGTQKFPGRYTLYRSGGEYGGLGVYTGVEVEDVEVNVGRYAQHVNAIGVTFRRKGCRKRSGYSDSNRRPNTVLIPGWGHTLRQEAFTPGVVRDGVTTHSTRYSSCDSRWDSDFAALLDAYLAERGLTLAFDARGHVVNDE